MRRWLGYVIACAVYGLGGAVCIMVAYEVLKLLDVSGQPRLLISIPVGAAGFVLVLWRVDLVGFNNWIRGRSGPPWRDDD
jgi:hypothetical protein